MLEPALDEITEVEVEALGTDGDYLATAKAALHTILTALRFRSADGEQRPNLPGRIRCSSWVTLNREGACSRL
jgi:hypothetical protein